MVFEVFGFMPRAEVPDVTTYTFGSTIANRTRARSMNPEAWTAYLSKHPHDEQDTYWPLDDVWITSEHVVDDATTVELRGRRLMLPSREQFARHGIELEDPERVHVYELCRFLADVARDDVLAKRDERRAHVPDELIQILVLDEWTHPDLAGSQKPSKVESMRQLARVLETGDVNLYRPTTPPNTHWKHWPEGGTL